MRDEVSLVAYPILLLPVVLIGFRATWQVRQEHATLQDAANRTEYVPPMASGVPESFGLVQPRDIFSSWHPCLPPSALGRRTIQWPEQANAPMEDVAHQMAGILRAVEAKVRRIEVRVDGSHACFFLHARLQERKIDVFRLVWRSGYGTYFYQHRNTYTTTRCVDASR